MRISNSLKSTLTWIVLLGDVLTALTAAQSTGVWQIIAILGVVGLSVLVFHWREMLNYTKGTEIIHTVYMTNQQGDVDYFRETAFVPLLWQKKTSEVFVSTSSGLIENVEANCYVEWKLKEEKNWRGTAHLNSHRGRIFAFGKPFGTRIELNSKLRSAFTKPPFDFVVTCPEQGASRIIIRFRWHESCRPLEAFAQSVMYPTSFLRKVKMIDTSKLPWHTDASVKIEDQPDNSKTIEYIIDAPKRCYMYRIFWLYSK